MKRPSTPSPRSFRTVVPNESVSQNPTKNMLRLSGQGSLTETDRRRLENLLRDERKMTPEIIKLICLDHEGYENPKLNRNIFLHFKGFVAIEGLDAYTEATCLWLESNGIKKIENLSQLSKLTTLYLQDNAIQRIENLDCLKSLTTLDLSGNNIARLENLDGLPSLRTLNVSKNLLNSFDSIAHLQSCRSLTSIDLSCNRLEDPKIGELFVASRFPHLSCLSLRGNAVVSKIKSYRKTLVSALPSLGRLDARPIYQSDRLAAIAWKTGGSSAERESRCASREQAKQNRREQMIRFREWKVAQREKNRHRRAQLTNKTNANESVTIDVAHTKDDCLLVGRRVNNIHVAGGGLGGLVTSYDRSNAKYRVEYVDGSWDDVTKSFLDGILLPLTSVVAAASSPPDTCVVVSAGEKTEGRGLGVEADPSSMIAVPPPPPEAMIPRSVVAYTPNTDASASLSSLPMGGTKANKGGDSDDDGATKVEGKSAWAWSVEADKYLLRMSCERLFDVSRASKRLRQRFRGAAHPNADECRARLHFLERLRRKASIDRERDERTTKSLSSDGASLSSVGMPCSNSGTDFDELD